MWNISDKSAKFCERIIKAGLHADMFGYLKSDVLSPANITGRMEEVKKIFVQGQLGTLHNVVQKAKGAREEFRDCDAVEILQPFREQTSRGLQVHDYINLIVYTARCYEFKAFLWQIFVKLLKHVSAVMSTAIKSVK